MADISLDIVPIRLRYLLLPEKSKKLFSNKLSLNKLASSEFLNNHIILNVINLKHGTPDKYLLSFSTSSHDF